MIAQEVLGRNRGKGPQRRRPARVASCYAGLTAYLGRPMSNAVHVPRLFAQASG